MRFMALCGRSVSVGDDMSVWCARGLWIRGVAARKLFASFASNFKISTPLRWNRSHGNQGFSTTPLAKYRNDEL